MSDLFLVTIEATDDGTWCDDPEGFDTEREAKEYAVAKLDKLPRGWCAAVYSCRLLTTLERTTAVPSHDGGAP